MRGEANESHPTQSFAARLYLPLISQVSTSPADWGAEVHAGRRHCEAHAFPTSPTQPSAMWGRSEGDRPCYTSASCWTRPPACSGASCRRLRSIAVNNANEEQPQDWQLLGPRAEVRFASNLISLALDEVDTTELLGRPPSSPGASRVPAPQSRPPASRQREPHCQTPPSSRTRARRLGVARITSTSRLHWCDPARSGASPA